MREAPKEVFENVSRYLKAERLNYEPIMAFYYSNHPADDYLFMVLARKIKPTFGGNYSCWTCWNESTQCLNYGHYDMSFEDAVKVLAKAERKIGIEADKVYDKEKLLDVMESYVRLIDNSGDYPEVTLDDLKSSLKFVLNKNGREVD